jgi:hypothetical protein
MINLLNNQGYNVRLLSCSSPARIKNKYDLIIGFGQPLRNIALEQKTRVIFLVTEGPQDLAKKLENKNIKILKELGIDNRFLIKRSEKIYQKSDFSNNYHYVFYGNDSSRWSAYSHNSSLIIPTGLPAIRSSLEITPTKNRDLMWIGSSGLANKGMYTTFFVANQLSVDHLHLFGVSNREVSIVSKLREVFPDLKVTNYGFVPYCKDNFIDVVRLNPAVILPSVSEAAPTSILTMARNGLECFIGNNCGLMKGSIGINLCDSEKEYIENIQNYFNLSSDEKMKRLVEVHEKSNTDFSLNRFSMDFEEILKASE